MKNTLISYLLAIRSAYNIQRKDGYHFNVNNWLYSVNEFPHLLGKSTIRIDIELTK